MDEHLAVGEGEIDFHSFFTLVEQYTRDPVLTIEPHGGERGVRRGVEALERFLLPASAPESSGTSGPGPAPGSPHD
jgi:sugar phosphate isomerase/epimerase